MRLRANALLAGGLLAAVLAATLAAQQPGVHPVSGRRFAPVMGYQGAPTGSSEASARTKKRPTSR